MQQQKKRKTDPRFNCLVYFITLLLLLLQPTPVLMSIILLLLTIVMIMMKINVHYIWSKVKGPSLFILLMTAVQVLIVPLGETIFHFYFIHLTTGALMLGLSNFIRIMLVIVATIVFGLITPSYDVLLVFEKLVMPLRKIGINPNILVLIFKFIHRFIPTLFLETDKIVKAQASRGLDMKSATLPKKIKFFAALMLPIFLTSIKRTDDLSNAMAVRGYEIQTEKTRLRSFKK